jgi:hypothetical protein
VLNTMPVDITWPVNSAVRHKETADYIRSKKGQPGARSYPLHMVQGRSDHFGSYVSSLSLHFCKRLFSKLEPMTS